IGFEPGDLRGVRTGFRVPGPMQLVGLQGIKGVPRSGLLPSPPLHHAPPPGYQQSAAKERRPIDYTGLTFMILATEEEKGEKKWLGGGRGEDTAGAGERETERGGKPTLPSPPPVTHTPSVSVGLYPQPPAACLEQQQRETVGSQRSWQGGETQRGGGSVGVWECSIDKCVRRVPRHPQPTRSTSHTQCAPKAVPTLHGEDDTPVGRTSLKAAQRQTHP
ncbi:hypothetical protein KUCAC02_031929, partial [Chaenocephalus aceratus]